MAKSDFDIWDKISKITKPSTVLSLISYFHVPPMSNAQTTAAFQQMLSAVVRENKGSTASARIVMQKNHEAKRYSSINKR